MGAALWLWHDVMKKERNWKLTSPYLGPEYTEQDIESTLQRYNAIYKKEEDDTLLQVVAEVIDSGKVIGWYQGRQEWGPRALGNRSILGDPRHPKMRENYQYEN